MNYEDRGNLLQPKPFPGPTLGWRNEAGWQSQFENEGRIQDALSFFATSPNVIYSDSQILGIMQIGALTTWQDPRLQRSWNPHFLYPRSRHPKRQLAYSGGQ